MAVMADRAISPAVECAFEGYPEELQLALSYTQELLVEGDLLGAMALDTKHSSTAEMLNWSSAEFGNVAKAAAYAIHIWVPTPGRTRWINILSDGVEAPELSQPWKPDSARLHDRGQHLVSYVRTLLRIGDSRREESECSTEPQRSRIWLKCAEEQYRRASAAAEVSDILVPLDSNTWMQVVQAERQKRNEDQSPATVLE